jgi:hypothetical protein
MIARKAHQTNEPRNCFCSPVYTRFWPRRHPSLEVIYYQHASVEENRIHGNANTGIDIDQTGTRPIHWRLADVLIAQERLEEAQTQLEAAGWLR